MKPSDLRKPIWDKKPYRTIKSAHYDEDRNELKVCFSDGSCPTLDPTPLAPSDLEDLDWWFVAYNEHIILVPHAGGWFEIPWDVIRRETDPDYAAYWEALARDYAKRAGSHVGAMRQRVGLSLADLAGRSGISETELRYLERGRFPLRQANLDRVLDAMGSSLSALFADDKGPAKQFAAQSAD